MRQGFKALGLVLAVALFAAAGASAQPRGQTPRAVLAGGAQQARAYLENGMSPHLALGYQRDRTVPDLLQPLPADTPYIWSVYLRAGENYRIYGACDDKCSDADMEVYGADGVMVDRDVAGDDTPYVQITPTETGRHFVRVWAFNCEHAQCFVAARVVVGGRPASRPVEPPHEDGDDDHDGGGEGVVNSELDESGEAQIQAGYTPFGDDVIEAIRVGSEGHREFLHLEAGRPYVFVGACDQSCTDVDMEIIGPRGEVIASDMAPDDRPVVGVTPPRDGDYVVHITLADCSEQQCVVGMRGFRRERARR